MEKVKPITLRFSEQEEEVSKNKVSPWSILNRQYRKAYASPKSQMREERMERGDVEDESFLLRISDFITDQMAGQFDSQKSDDLREVSLPRSPDPTEDKDWDNNAASETSDRQLSESDNTSTTGNRSPQRLQDQRQFIHGQMARLALELSQEKENTQLAASAGKSLLEELVAVQEDKAILTQALDAKNVDFECAVMENKRLKGMCSTMEHELRQYDVAWGKIHSPNGASQARTSISSRDDSGPVLSRSVSEEGIRNLLSEDGDASCSQKHSWKSQEATDSGQNVEHCVSCERASAELEKMRTEKGLLQRRCLDLEVEQERVERNWMELSSLSKRNEICLNRVQADYAKALQDIEYMTAQIQNLKDEKTESCTARDNLRLIVRNLAAENTGLQAELAEKLQLVHQLQTEKLGHITQCQVNENRIACLEKKNGELRDAIQEYRKLSSTLDTDDSHTAALRKQVADSEVLIAEAHEKWRHAQLENSRLRSRLLSLNCQDNDANIEIPIETTAADILQGDEQHQRIQSEESVHHSSSDEQDDHFEEDQCNEVGKQEDEEEIHPQASLFIGLSLIACATALRYYLLK